MTNATKLASILLNVCNNCIQRYLENEIVKNKTKLPNGFGDVFNYAFSNKSEKRFEELLIVLRKNGYFKGNKKDYPNNLSIFDLTNCHTIALFILREHYKINIKMSYIRMIYSIRNDYYAHLVQFGIDNLEFRKQLQILITCIQNLCFDKTYLQKYLTDIGFYYQININYQPLIVYNENKRDYENKDTTVTKTIITSTISLSVFIILIYFYKWL